MENILQIKHFSFAYPEQKRLTLTDIDLSVGRGEFLVLCGPSGCGKSTLLRQLKTVLAPHGERQGEIRFAGRPLAEIDQREQSARIGFVQQSPDNQIVTDKVWHELAFGLESLGMDTPTIRRRVAEMASFFGIQTWFYRDTAELSGGQECYGTFRRPKAAVEFGRHYGYAAGFTDFGRAYLAAGPDCRGGFSGHGGQN